MGVEGAMSNIREYIGCKSIEAVNYDGKGNTLCNMWVTDEEIVRCRDCKRFNSNETCALFDDAFVEPDGFCKWGERR